jgi:hypothetical protein
MVAKTGGLTKAIGALFAVTANTPTMNFYFFYKTGGVSEKFKKSATPLFRPRSVDFCYTF